MLQIQRMYRKLLEGNVQLPKDKLKELACQLSKIDAGVDDRIDFNKEAVEFFKTQIDGDEFVKSTFEFLKNKNWNVNERRFFLDNLQKQFEFQVVLYILLEDYKLNSDE